MKSPLRLVLAVTLLTRPTLSQAAPEDRGPHEVTTWEAGFVASAGVLLPTTVYLPADLAEQAGPVPVVAVLHGAGRTGVYMTEMAQTLASYGLIAVVPSIPCLPGFCAHGENARQISGMLEWAVAQGGEAESPLFGHVDATRRGVVGHSWGGLGSLLATAADPEIDAAVYLDPNDDFGGPGLAAAAEIEQPVAILRAERLGTCNSLWQNETYTHFTGPRLELTVTGAGHCDVESPTDPLCPTLCGLGSADTTPLFRRYAVAFTLCVLTGEPAMAPFIGGAELTRDTMSTAIGGVRSDSLGGLPCHLPAPAPDAAVSPDGVSPLDAGAGDARGASEKNDLGLPGGGSDATGSGAGGTPSPPSRPGQADAEPQTPGLEARADASADTSADTSGQHRGSTGACSSRPGPASPAGPLALGLVLFVRRRRRRARRLAR